MKKRLLLLCTIVSAVILFTSCKKNDDAAATAYLMVVNASPNGTNIDASVNNSVVVSNMAYPNNSGYKAVATGTNNITVSQTGTSSPFLNGSLNTEAGSYYSLYVVDSVNKRKATVTKDDLTPPAAGKAKVRLLTFSPNAPSFDVTINGASSANFSNRSFNDVSTNSSFAGFTEVDAAGLNLQVKAAGTSTVIATIPTIQLQAGKIYTLILKGFVGGAGSQALGIEVITHN